MLDGEAGRIALTKAEGKFVTEVNTRAKAYLLDDAIFSQCSRLRMSVEISYLFQIWSLRASSRWFERYTQRMDATDVRGPVHFRLR